MNQIIEQLAKQAAEYAIELTVKYPELYIPTFTEKFAELIVRECADIVEETRWMVPPSQEQIARSIKQHFGVEE